MKLCITFGADFGFYFKIKISSDIAIYASEAESSNCLWIQGPPNISVKHNSL
jgi:hypothetical protein